MQFRKQPFCKTAGALALLFASTLGAGGIPGVAQNAPPTPVSTRIQLTRFWLGEGRTRVDGVIGVPIRGAVSERNTQVDLVVRDQSGQVLHRESWTDTISERVAAMGRSRGAEVTVPVSFAVQPGTYDVTVVLTRGAQRDSARQQISGFAARPLISDVLVTTRIRSLGENEQPTAAEMRRGRFAIERGTRTTVLPTEPRLSYYLELYPVADTTVTEQLEFAVVRMSGGEPLFRTQRPMAVSSRGGADAAALVVQGLPPGDYRLLVSAKVGERSEQRETTFSMGSIQDVPVAAPAPTASESDLMQRYFTAELRLDSAVVRLVDALTLASPAEAVPGSTRQLSIDAQRRFLARFWSRIPDPVPTTAQHELLEEYVSRVEFVSREYVEKDIGRAGARTDRGRIYLKFGPPDAKQTLPMTGNRAVEVWKYTRARNLKFAFLDETGFSNFNLVYTTDPQEQSLSDWRDRVRDTEAVRWILSF